MALPSRGSVDPFTVRSWAARPPFVHSAVNREPAYLFNPPMQDVNARESIVTDGYEYDIFLSYPRGRRTQHVAKWVQNHFHPVLYECLIDEMAHEPRIFVDWEMESGVKWPLELTHSLLRSRYLVAVWTPQYFQSGWCLAEWGSMLSREKRLRMGTVANRRGLVYPVVFSDGDHFPEEARLTQYKADLSQWNYPDLQFRDSLMYLDFRGRIREVAKELAALLPYAPSWEKDWPVETPTPVAPGPAHLQRL